MESRHITRRATHYNKCGMSCSQGMHDLYMYVALIMITAHVCTCSLGQVGCLALP